MARSTLRPMRPKPEIAILTAMGCSIGCSVVPCRRRASSRCQAARKLMVSPAACRPHCQYDTSNRVNNASTGRTVASPARWLTVQVPAPIVGATEGRAPQALAALNSSGFSPMARRRATKASGKSASAAARAPRVKAKDGPAVGTIGERLAAVERERNALQEELARSRSRVRLLEETHARVRDRIAWALDSLHNILE